MKRLFFVCLLSALLIGVAFAESANRNIQDNYKFVYTILDANGVTVSGQTATLKIFRASDGYIYDNTCASFQLLTAATWPETTLSYENGYYYKLFNPPATESGPEQYLFVVANTNATYYDLQVFTANYQDLPTSKLIKTHR